MHDTGIATQSFWFERCELRTVVRDTRRWWVLADVCRALEHTNASKAVTLVAEGQKQKDTIQTGVGPREHWIISTLGTLELLCSSRLPRAAALGHWLVEETLPLLYTLGDVQLGGNGGAMHALRALLALLSEEDLQSARQYIEDILALLAQARLSAVVADCRLQLRTRFVAVLSRMGPMTHQDVVHCLGEHTIHVERVAVALLMEGKITYTDDAPWKWTLVAPQSSAEHARRYPYDAK